MEPGTSNVVCRLTMTSTNLLASPLRNCFITWIWAVTSLWRCHLVQLPCVVSHLWPNRLNKTIFMHCMVCATTAVIVIKNTGLPYGYIDYLALLLCSGDGWLNVGWPLIVHSCRMNHHMLINLEYITAEMMLCHRPQWFCVQCGSQSSAPFYSFCHI